MTFDRRRFDPAMGASIPELMARPSGGLRIPVPPIPWGGDWSPDQGELARWGSSLRLTLDQKNQPDTTNGETMQALLDVPFPVPLPFVLIVNVVDTAVPGTGIEWQTQVWAQVTLGVGRGRTVLNTLIDPPFNPPPPGTFPKATLFTTGFLLPAQHVQVQVRFAPGAIVGETVDVFGGLAPVV